MFNTLTLTRDVLSLFAEADRYGRRQRHDRTLAWAAHHTERLRQRDARTGWPTVIGREVVCSDGWRFTALPLNPPAPPRRTFGGLA